MKINIHEFFIQIENFNRALAYKFLSIFIYNERIVGKLNPNKINRILILRWDAIGDMIVTLPIFKYLKEINPNIEIHVLASRRNARIIAFDPNVDYVHVFNGKIIKSLSYLLKLRKVNFDAVIAAFDMSVTKQGIISSIVGNKTTVKIIPYKDEKRWVFFNMQSRLAASTNTMWERFKFLIYDTFDTDIKPESIKPYISIPDEIYFTINIFLLKLNIKAKEYIVINLSAGQRRNQWSDEGYMKLIELISINYSMLKIVLITMPNEMSLANKIVNNFKDRVYLYPVTDDILEIGALIDKSQLVISTDTGIVHFGSALNIPIIGLYQDYKENHITWRPYNIPYKIVKAEKDLYIETIPYQTVFEAFCEMMKELIF